MWDQIITLKHKSYGMISIRVPVPVFIFFRRNPIDDQIATIVPVKTTNNIQKSGFSRTAGTKNCHKFIVPKTKAHSVQGTLYQISCSVFFVYVFDLKHLLLPFCRIINVYNHSPIQAKYTAKWGAEDFDFYVSQIHIKYLAE